MSISLELGKNISTPSEEKERRRCGRARPRLPYVIWGLRFLVIAQDPPGTFAMPEVCACSLQLDLHWVGAYVKVQEGSMTLQ